MNKKNQADIKMLKQFISVFCHKKHNTKKRELCPNCQDLFDYAQKRLAKCPYDPKPKCKDCKTHCYQADYRKRIQEVMKFAGIHYVKRGRVDWLIKYFLKK